MFSAPFRDRNFRSFIAFTSFWHVAAMTGAPFISYFLLTHVGMSVYRVLLLWTFDTAPVEPAFPLVFEPEYAELVIRGMARMVPALHAYLPRLPRCAVDGGYYTKTRENRFLAGPLPVAGAYVAGALSGYGLMASSVAADLVADSITERPPAAYAPAFRLDRYDDPAYRARLEHWGDSGQL